MWVLQGSDKGPTQRILSGLNEGRKSFYNGPIRVLKQKGLRGFDKGSIRVPAQDLKLWSFASFRASGIGVSIL